MELRRWTPFTFLVPDQYVDNDARWRTFDFERWSRSTYEWTADGDPLHVDAVDFYDSGVWVTHAGGRDFFPYERVLRIREEATGGEAETAGERRDAASGTTGAVDETTLDVE
ncbi:hypothetical protein [Haloplanus natans]|uniref:hypothetical protein n=1 Tax=Haloplanus natans TaxID=376171 RepID=UPI00067826D5|nr:hypothetical protein [Haloplanus natans]